jgi:hypothetical protein
VKLKEVERDNMSTAIAIPESREIAQELPSNVLYQLEEAGQIATEILDERVTAWKHEGSTQKWIAGEFGCSQQAVSKRQKRLGIKPSQPQAPRSNNPVVTDPVEHVTISPEDIVEPEPQYPRVPLPETIPLVRDGSAEEVESAVVAIGEDDAEFDCPHCGGHIELTRWEYGEKPLPKFGKLDGSILKTVKKSAA